MLLRVARAFSKQIRANTPGLDSNLEDVLAERRRARSKLLRQQKDNLPVQQHIRNFYDSLVKITLYMRYDSWQSQYLYLLLNYNKLGFRQISDLVQLDRASYFLQLRKLEDSKRWPAIKVVIALEPKIILTGIQPITQFFRENKYFFENVEQHSGEIKALQDHIDNQVLVHMQRLLWHPKLTYQYLFHSHIGSYADTSRSYSIFGILGRNFILVAPRMVKNFTNIIKNYKEYQGSKLNFQKSVKELQSIYLTKNLFFGGQKPNHIDFYLASQLRTKSGCGIFMQYLQEGIGGQFWRWWIRMANLCQYNPDRITTL